MRSATKVLDQPRFWDEESLARLVSMNADGMTDPQIARALGRTIASVQHKRHLLRLATPVDHRRGRRMAEQDNA
ncbi:MAG: hypothetical protein PW843_29070 [Azospirillaceae bacterium]|nr:hypothetical protein [Azospirillaceae bacterium]